MDVASMSDAELRFASHCYRGQVLKGFREGGDFERVIALLETADKIFDEQIRRVTRETDFIVKAMKRLRGEST